MHIIPDTQIVKPIEQWSPYPHGRDKTQATAWENMLAGIPRDVNFFEYPADDIELPLHGPPTRLDDVERAFFEKQLVLCNPAFREPSPLPPVPPVPSNVRFGETLPISMGFTPAICEGSAIMSARDWLESDGIPEAIGTDDEDTKPCAPRVSEPVYPGRSLAW